MNILKNALLSSVLTMGVVLGAGAEQFDGRAPGGTEVAISASEQEYLKATAAYNDKQILITTLLTELLKYAKPKENDLVQNGPLTDVAFEVDDYFRRLVDERNSLKAQLEEVLAHVQMLTNERDGANSTVKTLTAEVERFTAENTQLEEKLAKAEEMVQKLEADNTVADEDLAIIQHDSSDEENGGSSDPLIAGGSAYKEIGSQPGSAWSVRAESLFAPRPSSQSQMPTIKKSQTTLTAEGLAAAAKVAALQPEIDGALSTPRGIQQQQQPSAAEVALTAEEIANQKNILEYIKLVVVEGEPQIYQYKSNPPTKEEQNKKVSSLEAKARYDRKVKDCQKMYRLTVVVQPNDRAEVLALINGPLKKKRQEWEGNIPDPDDQSSIGKAYVRICDAQKAYDEAYNKLIELATEKYSAPADSPSPAKEIK